MISGTLAAQLLKTSRTRGVVMLLLAVAASAAIATAAPGLLAGRKDATHTTIEAAITLGTAIAYLLGVSISAGDRQHGMTRTLLLIQPRRVRYLGSCLAAAAIAGCLAGVLTAATAVLARQLTASAPSAVDSALTITGGAAAGAGYAVLGLALGVLIPNQIGAASTGLLYTLVAEPLISQQSYEVYLKLPGGAREALVRHTSASHHIPAQPVGLITLGVWAALFTVAAVLVYVRRDTP